MRLSMFALSLLIISALLMSCERQGAVEERLLTDVDYSEVISWPGAGVKGDYQYGEEQGGLVVAALPLYQDLAKGSHVPLAVRIKNSSSTDRQIYRQSWVFTLKSSVNPDGSTTRSVGSFDDLPADDAYETLPAGAELNFAVSARLSKSDIDPSRGVRLHVNIPNPSGFEQLAPPPLYDENTDLISGSFAFSWEDQVTPITSEALALLMAAIAGDTAAQTDLLGHPGRRQALERALRHPDINDVALMTYLINHPEMQGDDIIIARLTHQGPLSVNHLFLNHLAWSAIEAGTAGGRNGMILAFAKRGAEGTDSTSDAHATRDTYAAVLAANGFHEQAVIEQRRAYAKCPDNQKADLASRVVSFTAASLMPAGVPRPDPLATNGFSGDATRAYLVATLEDSDPHLQSAARTILQNSFDD